VTPHFFYISDISKSSTLSGESLGKNKINVGNFRANVLNNKDKNTHRSNQVVYKGDCYCGVDCIGETVRNLAVRIAEHSNPAHTSETAKHLRENPAHSFTWSVLSSAQARS